MDLKQAQIVLGEVLQALERSALDEYRSVGVRGGKDEESGYSVYLRAFVGAARKQEIQRIVEKFGLSMTEDKDGITIK